MNLRLPQRLSSLEGTGLTNQQAKRLLERFCAGKGLYIKRRRSGLCDVTDNEYKLLQEYLHDGHAYYRANSRAYPCHQVYVDLYYLRGWVIWINYQLVITKEGRNWLKVVPLTPDELDWAHDLPDYDPKTPCPAKS